MCGSSPELKKKKKENRKKKERKSTFSCIWENRGLKCLFLSPFKKVNGFLDCVGIK